MTSQALTLVINDAAAHFAQPMMQSQWPSLLKKTIKHASFNANDKGKTAQWIELFSQVKQSSSDVPAAALRGSTLCIDPCYLHADRDKLLLFHLDLKITDAEAKELITLIQPLMAHLGQITQHTSIQWCLKLNTSTKAHFTSIEQVHSRPVTHALPSGEASEEWIKVWNEIQMTLFDCEINKMRAQNGELPINGVWFWGQGDLPKLSPWSHVSGDVDELRVLVEQSGSSFKQVSDLSDVHQWPAMHVEQLAEDNLLDWCDHWLYPALKYLRWLKIRQLKIVVPGWGEYSLNPFQAWYCR
jgi:hypothetical protein